MRSSSDPAAFANYYGEYTVPPDIAGASWVRTYAANNPICGDDISVYHVLNSYGERPRPAPTLPSDCLLHTYIYLNELNVLYGIGTNANGTSWPIANIDLLLLSENRIYSGVTTITSPVVTD